MSGREGSTINNEGKPHQEGDKAHGGKPNVPTSPTLIASKAAAVSGDHSQSSSTPIKGNVSSEQSQHKAGGHEEADGGESSQASVGRKLSKKEKDRLKKKKDEEKREKEKQERAREKREAEEKEKARKARKEAEKQERERKEREKKEAERKERERKEIEKREKEQERKEAGKKERERKEKEKERKKEEAKLVKERKQTEKQQTKSGSQSRQRNTSNDAQLPHRHHTPSEGSQGSQIVADKDSTLEAGARRTSSETREVS